MRFINYALRHEARRKQELSTMLALLCGFLFTYTCLFGPISVADSDTGSSLQITALTQVAKRKIAKTVYEYQYQVQLTNSGLNAARAVKAFARSNSPIVRVTDKSLSFNDIPAGATVVSRDTLTVLMPENYPLKRADLSWRFQQSSIPVANAGSDQSVVIGAIVTLDGSASSSQADDDNEQDDDDESLNYYWQITQKPAGSSASLSNPRAVKPTFVVDRAGTYDIQLVVAQEHQFSKPDSVRITTANSQPVADAGHAQTQPVGSPVTLDGSASHDADGDPLSFNWTIIAKPEASQAQLANPTAVNPSFTPDKAGSYTVQLIVNDGYRDSEPAQVLLSTRNSPPLAQAGNDQTAYVNDTVTLDGSASTDVDGDLLKYSWSLLTKPAASLASLDDPNTVKPHFILDKPGVYAAQLVVHDAESDSEPDTVTVTTENSKPNAVRSRPTHTASFNRNFRRQRV